MDQIFWGEAHYFHTEIFVGHVMKFILLTTSLELVLDAVHNLANTFWIVLRDTEPLVGSGGRDMMMLACCCYEV